MDLAYKFITMAGALAMATSAYAADSTITNFQSNNSATLLIDGVPQSLSPFTSPNYITGNGGAGAGYSSTVVNNNGVIFFQAGTMAAGTGNRSTSMVEVSFDVFNGGPTAIDQMISTIFESNFGMYVANFAPFPPAGPQSKPPCTGADLANCTPIGLGPNPPQNPDPDNRGFGSFVSVSDPTPPSTLAYTSFLFEIVQDNVVVSSLFGGLSIGRDANNGLTFSQSDGFENLFSSLKGFGQFGGATDRVYAFSWEDTDFTANLNPIMTGETSNLTYRITTESWSDVSFTGLAKNLIVAFSCFADPLGGRGGSSASVFTIPGFGPSTCNDYRNGTSDAPSDYSLFFPTVFQGNKIVFTSRGMDPSAIPEPDTWAMLILGFGLVGFSMRRRSTATKVSA